MSVIALAAAALFPIERAQGQDKQSFFAGKQIALIVAGGAGGGYDLFARVYARHAGRHIPGEPVFVVKNNPAAYGLAAANTLYANTDPDGLTLAALTSSVPLDPLFRTAGARFDALKFGWLGSIGKQSAVCGVAAASRIRSVDDLRSTEIAVGSVGATSNSAVWPRVLNELMGTKFKIVGGYPPGGGTQLALERGEIEGICGLAFSTFRVTRPQWLVPGNKDFRVLLQIQMGRHPSLPDVPSVIEGVTDPTVKRVLELLILRQETGNPIAAPPGVPADRLEVLRAGFAATMADAEFLADAARSKLEIEPLSAADMEKLLASAYGSPEAVVERTRALLAEPAEK
jgi:tripartite-type tricarboxylate transporter receptor subunit TctC